MRIIDRVREENTVENLVTGEVLREGPGNVSYRDIQLEDTTNGTAVTPPDTARTFLAF